MAEGGGDVRAVRRLHVTLTRLRPRAARGGQRPGSPRHSRRVRLRRYARAMGWDLTTSGVLVGDIEGIGVRAYEDRARTTVVELLAPGVLPRMEMVNADTHLAQVSDGMRDVHLGDAVFERQYVDPRGRPVDGARRHRPQRAPRPSSPRRVRPGRRRRTGSSRAAACAASRSTCSPGRRRCATSSPPCRGRPTPTGRARPPWSRSRRSSPSAGRGRSRSCRRCRATPEPGRRRTASQDVAVSFASWRERHHSTPAGITETTTMRIAMSSMFFCTKAF